MLRAMFVETGESIDFSDMPFSKAAELIVTGKPVTLYLADMVVSYNDGTICAMDTFAANVAIKRDVPEDLAKRLLTLAIDDEASYDGVEDFFLDFDVRFVP